MKHQVMLTTLFSGDNISNKSFYYAQVDNGKVLYCDALMPAEATCKYMLATIPDRRNHHHWFRNDGTV